MSYLAFSRWCAALTSPAHLEAIMPWAGVTDLRRDFLEHGGIPESQSARAYYSGSLARGAGEVIAVRGPGLMEQAADRPLPLETITVPALVCGS